MDAVLDPSFVKAWSIRLPDDSRIGFSDPDAKVGGPRAQQKKEGVTDLPNTSPYSRPRSMVSSGQGSHARNPTDGRYVYQSQTAQRILQSTL